jgi:hypothetical protein
MFQAKGVDKIKTYILRLINFGGHRFKADREVETVVQQG